MVFHNLSGYDGHYLIKDVANEFKGDVHVLPLTKEKYISFSKKVENTGIKFKCIDSFKFMPAPLEKLAANLEQHLIVEKEFNKEGAECVELLTRKGFYPYEYIDSHEKLQETTLPLRDQFKSTLNNSDITEEEYEYAKKVWRVLKCRNLYDYTKIYMKVDVLLLAEIFEEFCEKSMAAYGLDPLHYYISPGLSWDAMLKMTGVQLELLTDIDMVLFIEKGIRGEISQCSNRHAEAFNQYMQNFKEEKAKDENKDKDNSFIMYYDVNNLV